MIFNNKNINNYLDNIDIIYWINLDRSINRRNNMINILKDINIPNKRISAIDGKLIPQKDLYNNFINENNGTFDRTPIEYACLLSHLQTIKEFSESPYEYALILEDDISLEYLQYWDKKIYQIIKDAPTNWDIIMLNYVFNHILTDLYTYNKNGKIVCCGSYLINKKGAKKLMDFLYRDGKFRLLKNMHHTSDNYIYALLTTYTYRYPYFTYPTNNDSTIHESHLWYHIYTKKLAFYSWQEKYNLIQKNKKNTTFILVLITVLMFLIVYYIYIVYKSK